MKKRKLIFPLIALSTVLISSRLVYAQITYDAIKELTIGVGIASIIKFLLGLITSVAVLFVIIGGFQYMTSAGNPDQIQKAKSTIKYSIIGLVIIILSYAIVKYIPAQFGLKIFE